MKRCWWHLFGLLGALDHEFEKRHQASEFGAILKRTSLRYDMLLYAVARFYV